MDKVQYMETLKKVNHINKIFNKKIMHKSYII